MKSSTEERNYKVEIKGSQYPINSLIDIKCLCVKEREFVVCNISFSGTGALETQVSDAADSGNSFPFVVGGSYKEQDLIDYFSVIGEGSLRVTDTFNDEIILEEDEEE